MSTNTVAPSSAAASGGAARSPLAWLLDGPAQIGAGRHAGAVAGRIDLAGNAAYVYPEIAGYYLQWLAWRASTGVDAGRLAAKAAGVQRWLSVWLADRQPPRTRIHFDGEPDWRNDAVFFFDLAMVLRGLASATASRLIAHDPGLVAEVGRQLELLIADDGEFDACRRVDPGVSVPERWSTRRGAFLTKAAAGVLAAARVFPRVLSETVEHAAAVTFDASVDALLGRPHRQAHPLLYAFEGVLSLPGHPRFRALLPQLVSRFGILLASADADGRLPETVASRAEERGPARVDVTAQALRVGCLLERHGGAGTIDAAAMGRLLGLLRAEVRPSGAVPFAMGVPVSYWNTWAAMFADQAVVFAQATEFDLRADPLLV